MRFPLVYEASTTRADFVRLLAQATGETGFREIGDRFCGVGWAVRLTRIAPMSVGLVRLERHRVEIEFHGLTPAQQDRFMERFTLHYQRGGG